MRDVLDVVVIGAGWAGLGVSHGLTHSGISHVVLERGRIGETWRSQRWNSFQFIFPKF
ncbi:MAG: FAD-dependent oxidoreductase [Devosia sp.]|uniref:FAD-dependent monooxygenase n=1 Tax=Devosia sp. TaxID=1871048 RepID=UPI002A437549|nr:FAD-dependent oxidoreductase [Devosia sp.]